GGMMAGRYSVGQSPLPLRVGNTSPPTTLDSAPNFKSIEQARAAQEQAQVMYSTATAFLAQQDTSAHSTDTPAAMRNRLAALDRTRDVLGEALNAAPYDPVING